MPGLNFLKKIRSKDGHHEHSNSPTSPTGTKQNHHGHHNAPGHQQQQQQPQTGGSGGTGSAGVAAAQAQAQGQEHVGGEKATVTAGAPHVNSRHANDGGGAFNSEQPQPSPSNVSPGAVMTVPSSPGAPPLLNDPTQNQPKNSPSIDNLVNAPQNDGSLNPNSHLSPFSKSATSLGPSIIPTVSASASPGTDTAALQKQQQAALPPPANPPPQHQGEQPADASKDPDAMQTDQPEQQPQQAQQVQQAQQFQPSGQPQQTQHVPQQQQQQQHSAQSVSGHQHQGSTSSTPRVTKGKYTLNDFDMLRTLGTGSFGRVHLVQSKHNQRFYAIKVLKKAQVVKMKQVEHTNDERRMLSDVKHPFLITLWGTFADVKNLYMVMDFVEGGELFSLLRKSGRFPNPVAKFYAAEVTLALEYMHSKNIIYRDLKPENLLLDRHGHLKITDFGFAKRVPDKTWTLCGTPDYLAPEVVSNKGYNKSVDWWSLGILIYEMLCGYTPFWDSGSPMRIYENILKGKVKYPSYIAPEAQDLLQKLITADLSKRLGNLYGGSNDVKNHAWFHEVTWDRLARKDIDAPYTPPVKAGAGDASQFDKYPEEHDKYGQVTGNDEYGHLFSEF